MSSLTINSGNKKIYPYLADFRSKEGTLLALACAENRFIILKDSEGRRAVGEVLDYPNLEGFQLLSGEHEVTLAPRMAQDWGYE